MSGAEAAPPEVSAANILLFELKRKAGSLYSWTAGGRERIIDPANPLIRAVISFFPPASPIHHSSSGVLFLVRFPWGPVADRSVKGSLCCGVPIWESAPFRNPFG